MSTEKPHRRFILEIRISADTYEDVREQLEYILRSIVEVKTESVMGGPTAGHIVKMTEDPTMTNAKYHAAVEQWIVSESRGKDPRTFGEADHECG